MAAIKARREELSDQLSSASSRRSRLVSQLNGTDNETARQGLEERIAILDKRMVQLETDIATTGQQLTSAGAGLLATTESAGRIGGLGAGQVTALSIVFTVVVLGPLAIGAALILLRRSNKPPLPPAVFTQTAERLQRLEESVDTIAIEIERISEGQRFVTKLLSEAQKVPALVAGKRGEPIATGNG
ncbi:MAG: hypothetical protein M3365_09765 [Gemmatimonadota bacterium]|nr:hypothetical protein [Gemmatimonadota bacterium]